MGSFFVRYFLSKGEEVVGSDIRERRQRGMLMAASDKAAAKESDVVLIATPMETTTAICRRLSAYMRKGSLLVEISSVKGRAFAALARFVGKRGVHFLSVHPMFGPALREYKGMRVAVIKEGMEDPLGEARRLFPEARLIPMNAEFHDRLMAVMLSLTHLVGMAYAQVISDVIDPHTFREIATPSSLLQLAIAEGLLSQDVALYSSIQFANAHTTEVVRSMALELMKLNEIVERGEERRFREQFKKLTRKFSVNKSSMEKVYRASTALSG